MSEPERIVCLSGSMNFNDLQSNWNAFGDKDAFRAILTDPNRPEAWTEADFFATGQQKIADLIADLNRLKITLSRGKALDFGCGAGRLTRFLAEHMDEVVGVDVAPSMIELAEQYNQYPDRVSFVLNQQTNLEQFPSHSFDLIYTTITLQHMRPQLGKGYLREFMRLLKPDGLVIFQVPSKRLKFRSSNPISWLADGLRFVIPESWISAIKALKYPLGFGPVMEMHSIPRSQVESLIHENQGTVLNVDQDDESGQVWLSYRYIVRKNPCA